MRSYDVSITETAEQDLKSIVTYIRLQLKEPGTAQRVYQTIRNEILKLNHMPDRYPLWQDEPWQSRGLRKLLAANYLVLYLVNHDQSQVRVVRIMYAGRNIAAQLQETNWDLL